LKKLAIISSHPIQYNAPLFAMIAKEPKIDLMVFYTWGEAALGPKFDPDFVKEIAWDIPLLEGYQYTFLQNTSKEPGSHDFKGINNPTLNQEIEAWGAEVLWVWGWAFDSHLKALRHFKGKIPIWFRGDSTLLDDPLGFSMRKTARRLFLRWVYRHVDKAFYVGTFNKAYFKAHGLKEKQLVAAPHAIDQERFADPSGKYAEAAKQWRKEMGIHATQRVLLFVGKFETKKNPLFFKSLIAAMQSSNTVGIMVGSGPLEPELKRDPPKNLLFLPFQNQSKMPMVYRLADALMLPSQGPGETWGLVMNEALACGILVFASCRCGGAIDLLQSKNAGFVFEGFSVPALIDRIETWFNNPANGRELPPKGPSYQEVLQAVLNQLPA
jgi:glycosyltransferase involved in cell wall biosynthesis